MGCKKTRAFELKLMSSRALQARVRVDRLQMFLRSRIAIGPSFEIHLLGKKIAAGVSENMCGTHDGSILNDDNSIAPIVNTS